jgi:hypothetical protein
VRKIQTTQKVQIALIVFVAIFIFYAFGIATNLFGNHIFSMFWIISNDTAHNVAAFAAIAVAIVLDVAILVLFLINRRKTTTSETDKKLVNNTNKALDETVVSEELDKELSNRPEDKNTEQKNKKKKSVPSSKTRRAN